MLAAQSRKFRYLADPLFLGAVMLYALNRWWWKPRFGDAFPFLHDHFNDCLLIPVALPPLLWIFPRFFRLGTADWGDVLSYMAGAVLSAGFWFKKVC
ncbi:MAG: hypothetical protein WCK17_08155 [Verrucomicrobiota bacterium]